MNSFKGIFDSILSPHAPHVLTEASPPPSNFEEPPSMGVGGGGAAVPMFSIPVGNHVLKNF